MFYWKSSSSQGHKRIPYTFGLLNGFDISGSFFEHNSRGEQQ